ncbi:MAG: enoyl-CoA hydratase/isomerase family protein [Glaciimonas sp.]|nr:enoyl-CoA hydratase/isomerase family protein [Glaciimonas sp.]
MVIHYTLAAHVATITIDRPEKRNALAPTTMVELRDAFLRFDQDPEARVAIITGAGDKAFCAGADLHETLPSGKSFIEGYFDRTIGSDHPLYIRNISLARLRLKKPLIAAVNGVAVAGGMEIALNCDLCIASTNARFGLTEVRIGSIPAIAGIQRMMRSLPRAVAMQWLLTAEIVDAAKALQWGLVSEIVEPDELMPRARAIAAIIAANAPLAVLSAKMLADKSAELSFAEAAEMEELMWGHLYETEDRVEGRRAFAEKRSPVYHGR